MTNGEKIKEIFPNGVLTSINNSYYWGDDILVGKSFWNAEYKEPNKSEIPTGSDDCISRAEAQTEIEMNASRYTIAKERCGMGQVEWSDQLIKVSDAVDIIRKLPSVTPIRPKGHWVMTHDYLTTAYGYIDYVKCSCCGEDSLEEQNYCPNCGAKMEEVRE